MGTAKGDKQVGVNLPEALAERLDAFCERGTRILKRDVATAALWWFLEQPADEQVRMLSECYARFRTAPPAKPARTPPAERDLGSSRDRAGSATAPPRPEYDDEGRTIEDAFDEDEAGAPRPKKRKGSARSA